MAAAISAVLALSGPAFAGDAPDFRWLDRGDAASACIGDPATPACAVETLLACRIRGEAALCAAVGLNLAALEAAAKSRHGGLSGPDPMAVLAARAVEYRIDPVRQTGAGKARVSVAARFHGRDGLAWPEAGLRRLKYALHREDGAWRVDNVSWQPLVRFIDRHEAVSRCIGDARTPVCAVETHIACRIRGDKALCAKAGRVEGRQFRPKGATVTYMVTRIRRWQPPEQAPPGSVFVVVETRESTQWRPGDRPGEEGGAETPEGEAFFVQSNFVTVAYTLERRAGRWRVTNRTERP